VAQKVEGEPQTYHSLIFALPVSIIFSKDGPSEIVCFAASWASHLQAEGSTHEWASLRDACHRSNSGLNCTVGRM